MSPENPSPQDDRPSKPVSGNDGVSGNDRAKTEPLSLQDIEGLTEEQKQDENVQKAIADFNRKFPDTDNTDLVRAKIKEIDSEITYEDIAHLDQLAQQVRASLNLPANEAKGVTTNNQKGEATAEKVEGQETPEKRNTRLGEFVTTNFAEICPPEFKSTAVKECCAYEDECRKLFEDPTATLEPEDAQEAELQNNIRKAIKEAQNNTEIADLQPKTEDNDTVIAANPDKIETGKAGIAREEAKTPKLEKDVVKSQTTLENEKKNESTYLRDQKIIKENYPQPLKEQHGGSIGALRALEGMVSSPKMKERIQGVLNKIAELQNAIPGKSGVVTQILNRSHIDLSASSPLQMFAGFLADADKSDELTDEEKTKIREVLHGAGNIETSTDVKKAFEQGRGIRTLEDGTTEIIPYDKDHPLDHGDGVTSYPDGDNIILEAQWDGRKIKFHADKDTPNAQLTRQIANFMIHYEAKFMGLTDVSDQGIFAAQGGDVIELNEAIAHDKSSVFADTVRKELLGGIEGQTRFPSQEERAFVRWAFQWLLPTASASGDGGAHDNDLARQQEHLGGGGKDGLVFTADGTLKEDQFAKAAQFIRGQYGTGEPDFEALKKHLGGGKGQDTETESAEEK